MGAIGYVIRGLKTPEKAPQSQEEALSEVSEELSEQVEMLSDGRYIVSESCQTLSDGRKEIDHNVPKMPDWEHKALSKAQFERQFEPVPVILTCFFGGIAVVGTIRGLEFNIQLLMYAVMIMTFLVTNPLGMVERLLAIPSRIMLAVMIFMIDLSITFQIKNLILATVIISLIFGTCIMIGNKGWLIKEIYLATEFTRKAQRDDLEDLAALSWRGHSKSELWTMLEQLGLTVTENELNFGYRKAWRLGYYHGLTMVETKNVMIESYENVIEELQEQIRKAPKWEANFKETDAKLDDVVAELTQAKADIQHYEADLELSLNRERILNEKLQKYESQDDDAGFSEEIIKTMLEAGITYRQIEFVTGWNKYRTGEVKKKYGIEIKEKAG